MKGFSNSNVFLSEFIFRCPSITFLALSYLNDLILERQDSLEKLELNLRIEVHSIHRSYQFLLLDGNRDPLEIY